MIVAGTCSLVDRMYATAVPGMAPSTVAEDHIKTNSVGLQIRVWLRWYEPAIILPNPSGTPTVLQVSRGRAATHIVQNDQHGAVRHRHKLLMTVSRAP